LTARGFLAKKEPRNCDGQDQERSNRQERIDGHRCGEPGGVVFFPVLMVVLVSCQACDRVDVPVPARLPESRSTDDVLWGLRASGIER
jgi:hypothetical protein